MTQLLFVCMGNICRSPLAEGIFAHLVKERGKEKLYRLDSAGIGDWHAGEAPDPRSQNVAKKHGIELVCRARQVRAPGDFSEFDLLLAMDRQNRGDLLALSPPEHSGKIRLMRSFDAEADIDAEVPDPYYGGAQGFERVFAMLHRSCLGLLERLDRGGDRLA